MLLCTCVYASIKQVLLLQRDIGVLSNLRIHAMHKANTALLDILVDNSVIIPSF